MDVTFYINTSDKRAINKNLSSVGPSSSLTIIENLDILTPTFILTCSGSSIGDLMGFANYMYIGTLARYYYITDKKLLTGNRIQITGLVDPLYTYASQIKTCSGTVVRNENTPLSYIVDNQIPVESYLTVRFIAEAPLFDNKTSGTNFILNVAGGGSNSSTSGGETS